MAAPEPQAATAASYTPIVTDFLRLCRAPFAPTGVFEEQREKPTFWLPWLVLAVLFVAVGLVALPFTVQIARISTEAAGRPFPASAESVTKVFAIVLTPVGLLVGILIGAVVLYLVSLVTGVQTRFKGLMTVSLFVAPITFLQTLVTTIALRMRGLENIQSPADARITFGLDNLVSAEYAEAHKAVAALLRGVGPFEIWVLIVTALGLMALEKVPKNKAWTIAIVAFVVGLVIRMAAAMIFKTG